MLRLLSLPIVAAFCLAQFAPAADKKPDRKQAALSPKEAGPDYKVQGEYAGTIKTPDGDVELGVQVIAQGDGKFKAVAYPGGLPGAGWAGDEKIQAEGKTEGDVTILKNDRGTGTIKDGVGTLENDGVKLGTIKRVIRKSKTLGEKPPKNAVVLFDGSTADNFQGGKLSKDGLLMQGCTSKQKFQSFKLHVEFMLSYMPYARGQGRANSGVYTQGRYEVQVLDSFGLAGKHNECGGIYSVKDPDVNMCLPPLQWQTYDIEFTAAKFDESGKKTDNARMSVWHNGVQIHKDVEVPKSTTAAPVKEGPEPGPIYIQNHGNPIRFRNIWLVEKK